MINRALPFVGPGQVLTVEAWQDLRRMQDRLDALEALPGPYADNAAALAAGLAVGDRYFTAAGAMRVVV